MTKKITIINEDFENEQTEEMEKKIFAYYDENSIRVYQAYNRFIAEESVKLGTFGSNFKTDRMTWIKPSFLWMMYRSGWATKENQERILAIDIKREGFDFIYNNSVLSSFDKNVYQTYDEWKSLLDNSEARCQWDPERDIYGMPMDSRSIQLGIKGSLLRNYVNEWIISISDITDYVLNLKASIDSKKFQNSMLPKESEYFVRNSAL